MLPKKYQHVQRSLAVKKSHSGFGLFTKKSIEKGGFIIEYFGEILTGKESDVRGGKYLFETNKNRYIDGSTRKNIARYINHSCKPNCEVEIRRGRIYVFAKKKILAGEELSYDYGTEYCAEHIKPFGCRCAHCAS